MENPMAKKRTSESEQVPKTNEATITLTSHILYIDNHCLDNC